MTENLIFFERFLQGNMEEPGYTGVFATKALEKEFPKITVN